MAEFVRAETVDPDRKPYTTYINLDHVLYVNYFKKDPYPFEVCMANGRSIWLKPQDGETLKAAMQAHVG